MKIAYIADDGKQFDSEYDCEKYEMSKKMINIIFVDNEGHILSDIDDIVRAVIVIIPIEDAVEMAKEILKWHGISIDGIDGVGAYIYSNNEKWYGWKKVSLDYLRDR